MFGEIVFLVAIIFLSSSFGTKITRYYQERHSDQMERDDGPFELEMFED